MSVDELEDETDYFQLGQQHTQQHMKMKMQSNQDSSWNVYPDRYKFISLHFLLDQDMRLTERQTYSFLAYASDMGGLKEFLLTFFGVFAYPFSTMRMKALLTNRLHHVPDDQVGSLDALKEQGAVKQRGTGEIEVGVPMWLDWQYCRYYLACCCQQRSRNKSMRQYSEIIELGHQNFQMNLDIVRVIRRSRLHAIGLHFLLNKVDRNLSARLAFSTPLRSIEELEEGKLVDPSDVRGIKGETFYYIENL